VIPVAQDREMFEWLEALFNLTPRDTEPGKPKSSPDSFPEQVVLREVFDAEARHYGQPIVTKEWKPSTSPQPAREELVSVANEFRAAAQRVCNVAHKRKRFRLFALSSLKGADPYEQYAFGLSPTGIEYGGKGGQPPPSDSDDTHRDRLLESSLEHNRWLTVQYTEATAELIRLQQDQIKQQAETIARQDGERRQWILASEQALSQASERKIKEERAQVFNEVLKEGWESVRGLLPGIVAYATRGKTGIVEGLRQFLEGIAREPERERALFGKWEGGQVVERGILEEDQVKMLYGIADGHVDPMRITDFMASLSMEQLSAAQQVLKPSEIQGLMVLAKAAQSAKEKESRERENGAGA
jgi:hypothetical protein